MKTKRKSYKDVMKAKGMTLGPVVLRTKRGRGHWRIVSSCLPAVEVK